MPFTTFPVVAGAGVHVSSTGGDTDYKHPPGTIMILKTGDQTTWCQYLQMDNNGISQGEVAVTNFATLKNYSVKKAATTDGGGAPAGWALGTVASQKYGWFAVAGYVASAKISEPSASGEYLAISGSTAGYLTVNGASVFNAGTQGNASAFLVVARARDAGATAAASVGSIQIVGWWGV